MPKKGKKQPQTTEEDDIAFLEAAAAANQAAIAAAQKDAPVDTPSSTTPTKVRIDLAPGLPGRPCDEFTRHNAPIGEIMEYSIHRPKLEEQKAIDAELFAQNILPDLREGAEVHRRVRKWAMENVIKPGVNLYQMCSQIEEATRRLAGYEPIHRGLAFPCGCSLNNCAAHYTPTYDDGRVLKESDVMKIDFGVNINGHIIDSAFTVAFDSRYDPLLQASRDATRAGIQASGIDARLSEVGDAIQEVFDASTIELDGKTYQIHPISNLSGHLMEPYTIHAGKSLPISRGSGHGKMELGELYACETFGSTGKGLVHDENHLSHYMVKPNPPTPRTPGQRKLLKFLSENFSTLAFCQRFIEAAGETKYQLPLRQLVDCEAVVPYPALSDVAGSYVAQFEHTFIILNDHKEIISRGDDY